MRGMWATILIAAMLLLSGAAPSPRPVSLVARIEITAETDLGTIAGVRVQRLHGVIYGEVAAGEAVAGLTDVAAGRSAVPYSTEFDLVAPRSPGPSDGVVVEVENRGMGILPAFIGSSATAGSLPAKSGSGTIDPGTAALLRHHLAYARVHWQSGIAAGVPAQAQGVGEVILRDFGRLLGGDFAQADGAARLSHFRHRLIAGISQSAWMVNALIAEGFNRDPARGLPVYQAAFTRDGAGNVLAVNRFAGKGRQFAYLPLDRGPLTPAELLHRPGSDPLLVDVTALTDYYRVRASIFARASGPANLWRYATAAAHAPGGTVPPAMVFGTSRCNGGTAIPLNMINDGPYVKALLFELAARIGVATGAPHALPPSAGFALTPAAAGQSGVNGLPDKPLWLPRMSDGLPQGGIGLPEVLAPSGRAIPPALPPVTTASINATCGNYGGWQPWSPAELRARYGSRADYAVLVRRAVAALVAQGFLLREDAATVFQRTMSAVPEF